MIARGNRIYQLKIQQTYGSQKVTKTELRVSSNSFIKIIKDSFNLIPLKLSSFPKTFNLKDENGILEEKGIFPYLFNNPANYDRVLNTLPSIQHYELNLTKEKFIEFVNWYNLF